MQATALATALVVALALFPGASAHAELPRSPAAAPKPAESSNSTEVAKSDNSGKVLESAKAAISGKAAEAGKASEAGKAAESPPAGPSPPASAAATAGATEPPNGDHNGPKYEDAFVRSKVRKNHLTLEPSPEGKKIGEIVVEVEDTFDSLDLGKFARLIGDIPLVSAVPRVANMLHATTRRYVVARELLFAVGQPYRQAVVDETERNLRGIVVLAIAKLIPCKGSSPDTVRVLVATKDLFSLRFETDFQISGGRLDYLKASMVERNLAGRNKLVAVNFGLTRDTFSVGETFIEPRLLGTRIALEESAALTFGRGGRGLEGGSAHLGVGQPLYSLASKWAFEVTSDFSYGVNRSFRGGDFYRCFQAATATSAVTCDNAISSQAMRTRLLRSANNVTPIYEAEAVTVGASVTRRFGARVKHDVSFGYGLRHHQYSLLGDFPDAAFRDAVREQFLPRSEDASYLFGSYRTFDARYVTLRNVSRFALTEDYQYGHDVRLITRWANHIFGVDNIFVEVDGSAQYRWRIGSENLLTVAARAQGRAEASGLVNKRYAFALSNLSPVLGIGRLLLDLTAIFRFDDRDNVRSTLGGNLGLRGYDSDEFRGRHMINMHLEYRSLPLDILTLQVGFAAFWDAGHAADEVSQLKLRHSIGAGLRILLPQVNRMVIRVDLGFPLSDGGPNNLGQQLAISFDQAF